MAQENRYFYLFIFISSLRIPHNTFRSYLPHSPLFPYSYPPDSLNFAFFDYFVLFKYFCMRGFPLESGRLINVYTLRDIQADSYPPPPRPPRPISEFFKTLRPSRLQGNEKYYHGCQWRHPWIQSVGFLPGRLLLTRTNRLRQPGPASTPHPECPVKVWRVT